MIRRTLLVFSIFAMLHPSAAYARVPFNAGYAFTSGSDGYLSHAVFTDATLSDKDGERSLTGTLALSRDNAYEGIVSLMLKGKTRIGYGMNAGLLVGGAEGTLQETGMSAPSFSWGALCDSSLTDSVFFSLEYVHTSGSLLTEIYRDVLIQSPSNAAAIPGKGNGHGKKKKDDTTATTTSTTLVQTIDYEFTEYSSDTISAFFDIDLSEIVSRLSSSAQLSLSQISSDVTVTSCGFGLSYRLKAGTSFSGTFSIAGDNLDRTNRYVGIGVNQSF